MALLAAVLVALAVVVYYWRPLPNILSAVRVAAPAMTGMELTCDTAGVLALSAAYLRPPAPSELTLSAGAGYAISVNNDCSRVTSSR